MCQSGSKDNDVKIDNNSEEKNNIIKRNTKEMSFLSPYLLLQKCEEYNNIKKKRNDSDLLRRRYNSRMKSGISRLYELQPDPYDATQRKCMRVCVFTEVKNVNELMEMVRTGEIDAALIKAELVVEPFVLLAAANRAVHQAAHNRMSTRSLAAELIYSLSPTRNISESLINFGISEGSENLIVCVFDDAKGSKMVKLSKKIKGKPVKFEKWMQLVHYPSIKKLYNLKSSDLKSEDLCDIIANQIVSKDLIC
ncbi:EKC/KEOPS complex subunit TPRKB [Strongyloides ratti]|uniref:EKC/KEOPS complex subunit TPRKB n=1 Tax=Strongyloides ratti TaxID=34506 RepID=A0A090L8D6_STRRB|nr:EKC/KEOPS complex subunit TPRKB [Strongyloides ratti]CEF63720.1 EKC/KEOPS complex subunit TPRKB [Strongyloides ratti]